MENLRNRSPRLLAVMYHYVRDLPKTDFPRMNGLLTRDFKAQVAVLRERYEMATLESALAFLAGTYEPARDLCLLTFDDGLKDHYTDVTPVLEEHRIQGLFFAITSCADGGRVAPAHMGHFLMAGLGFESYRDRFIEAIEELEPAARTSDAVDEALASRTYRWDRPDVASFKYLVNFKLNGQQRDRVVRLLFEQHISKESQFAPVLYASWDELRAMQSAGMVIGGHSHAHLPLALLDGATLGADLLSCRDLLSRHLGHQDGRPFSYPFGRTNTFDDRVTRLLAELQFSASFSTEKGWNAVGADRFSLRRVDCNDVESATEL